MAKNRILLKILDNLENYLSQILLVFFVSLIFFQIVLRVVTGTALAWSEEISRFAFIWFVYLGAAYAARLGAHNRVTIQFKKLPKKVGDYSQLFADGIWIFFNGAMVYKGFEVINNMIEYPYYSPTLDWSMTYVYAIIPIAFSLMIIRIIQVNYIRFIQKIEIADIDHMASDTTIPLASDDFQRKKHEHI